MLKHAYDGEGHSSEFRTQSLKLDSLVRFFIAVHLWNRSWLFPACQSWNLQDLTSSNRTSLLANMGLMLGEPIPAYCHFLCPLTLPGSSPVMLQKSWVTITVRGKIPEEGRSMSPSSSWDKWALFLPVYMVAVQGLVPLLWLFNYSQVKHLWCVSVCNLWISVTRSSFLLFPNHNTNEFKFDSNVLSQDQVLPILLLLTLRDMWDLSIAWSLQEWRKTAECFWEVLRREDKSKE